MAPKFALPADDGTTIALEQLAGRFVVLFFYPKDDTPTCTAEACGFRDELPRFERLGAAVLGISPDSVKSHARFRKKHGLTYPLLSDEEHRVAERGGCGRRSSSSGTATWASRGRRSSSAPIAGSAACSRTCA